jgi:2-amino-4-hydroxy-6-hydroxymethyldihydropteridine diphosphokinase
VNRVIIGFGSNIDPLNNIREAIRILAETVEVVKVSRLVKTAPIGISDQPDFINGAVRINTRLQQEELRNLLKTIEDRLCRDRSLPRFGPRTIDLDPVVWNGAIIDPDYYTRSFLRNAVDELAD